MGYGEKQVYALPTDEFNNALRALGGTPDEVLNSPDLMRLIEPKLRADFGICERYVYRRRAPLSCPIFALYGCGDERNGADAVQGWETETIGGFSKHAVPGSHFFIHESRPSVLDVLKRLLLEPTHARSTIASTSNPCHPASPSSSPS